jgi:tyrosinase
MIWNKAQTIAASYPEPDRQRFVEAARTLRFPYWDWASNPEMPESIVTPEIIVRTPTGEQTIPNPLWSFDLDPRRRGGFPTNDPVRGHLSEGCPFTLLTIDYILMGIFVRADE